MGCFGAGYEARRASEKGLKLSINGEMPLFFLFFFFFNFFLIFGTMSS